MIKCDFRGCAFLNTLAETPENKNPLRKEILMHKKQLLDDFQFLVDEHFKTLPKKERTQISRSIFIVFEGALIEAQNFRELWPIKTAKKQVKQMLE